MSNGYSKSYNEATERIEAHQEELQKRPDIIMAKNSETDPTILKAFAEGRDQDLRTSALMNPSTPDEVIEGAIFEGTEFDAMAAGHNPKISEQLRTIAQFRYVDMLPDGELKSRINRMRRIVRSRSDRY